MPLHNHLTQSVEWDYGADAHVKLPGRTVNVWGRDLSGTLGGAGGIGGLLAVQCDGVWHFPLYDGGGNITAYISESGAVAATYAYGPYGETVSHTGQDFDYRFSTKPYNEVLNTYRFAYREYAPDTGRWLSQDPIFERGGHNLYAYCGNDPVNGYDPLGLKEVTVPKCHAILILGHTVKSNPYTWKFDECNCGYGGVVGCRPYSNNPDKEDNRWPRVPFHDDVMLSGVASDIGQNNYLVKSDVFDQNLENYNEYEAEHRFLHGVKNAMGLESFKDIIKKLTKEPCACDEITFEIWTSKGGWEVKEAFDEFKLKKNSKKKLVYRKGQNGEVFWNENFGKKEEDVSK